MCCYALRLSGRVRLFVSCRCLKYSSYRGSNGLASDLIFVYRNIGVWVSWIRR